MNAYCIAEQYTEEFSVSDLPIDVFAYLDCLQHLGLLRYTVQHLSSKLCGWIATRNGQRFYIAVNSRHVEVRRRFTAAHELGHLLLHRRILTPNMCFNCSMRPIRLDDDDRREREANAFAAEFLMPRRLVYALIDSGRVSATGLAERFRVSGQAMHWRLETLKIPHDMASDTIGGDEDVDTVNWSADQKSQTTTRSIGERVGCEAG